MVGMCWWGGPFPPAAAETTFASSRQMRAVKESGIARSLEKAMQKATRFGRLKRAGTSSRVAPTWRSRRAPSCIPISSRPMELETRSGHRRYKRTATPPPFGKPVTGGYVVAGFSHTGAGAPSVVKTDELGNVVWSSGNPKVRGTSVLQTRDGGYLLAGITGRWDVFQGDVYLLKLAPDGPVPAAFQRGDSDAGGAINLTDAVFTLSYLFRAGPAPGCLDAADADDNGAIQITDAIFTLNQLFLGGPQLPNPPGSCGADPSEDELGCERFQPCL